MKLPIILSNGWKIDLDDRCWHIRTSSDKGSFWVFPELLQILKTLPNPSHYADELILKRTLRRSGKVD